MIGYFAGSLGVGFEENICTGASVLVEAEVQTIFKNREWVA